ncbi:ATP-dependent 6-phosphofructokinase 4, chloroplastic [Capsicum baccatum]|uniref:ATP-dependent 6-phosphofructokinase n=1 Tax=Capsicum baccatum TaxID=33114 RepID=A0A2G2X4Y3_CAPBA|nr:ATP-dependent 6-phosphofructokinase 4, chloroplastic [Capsicum baccatum]
MELSLSNSSSFRFRRYDFVPRLHSFSRLGSFHTFSSNKSISVRRPLIWRQPRLLRIKAQTAIDGNSSDDFIIEDVPHLTYFLPDLPSYTNPLKRSQAYAIVKKTFVNPEDMVAKEIIVQKDSPRGIHFRRAGPREKVFFTPEEVRACIVTCGGLCPGINTVIREIVCGLKNMYGVDDVLGIQGGYSGFYSKNTLNLTTKVVNDIHKRGGTFLQTSRGGHDTKKIVDNIQDRGINQVYIIGGDGTQKGAAAIYKEVEKRGIKVAVAGIPKTIDNDIAVIDKSFGFDTAVEEAQRAINAAHVEAESVENGVGIVKLMGRYSGFIAMLATLGNRDVDCCLIPESPFYLEGPGGLYEYVEQQLKENRHVLIVLAEGAGQEYVAQSMQAFQEKDASGNRLLLDVGLWLTQHIKDHFTNVRKMTINMKYIGSIGDYDCINIDMAPEISLHRTFTIQKQRYYEILAVTNENPTYMIRAIPSNASDNIYCTLLAQSAVHGAMAGFTGFTVGPVNSRHAYIPINRVTETTNTVNITGRMWARLLASTNQPSFVHHCQTVREKVDKQTIDAINNMQINSI